MPMRIESRRGQGLWKPRYLRHGDLSLHPLISGMPPEIGWEQLKRFEAEILPHVQRS